METNVKAIFRSFIVFILAFLLSIFPLASQAFAVSPNLIANDSVELATNGLPQNWTTNSWGTSNASFEYSPSSRSGKRSLLVNVSNYVSGDAKWMADQVAVTPGSTYLYTDYSKSNVVTELDIAYVTDSGATRFEYLKSIPASTAWQQNSASFTAPAGITSVSIYHIIYSNGALYTDDFALSETTPSTPPPASSNLIANGSFETPDGANPAFWSRGGWGANSSSLNYVTGGARTGDRRVSITMNSTSSGDAKWYTTPIATTSGSSYTYEDYYISTIPSRVVAVMTNQSGIDSYAELAPVPQAAAWARYNAKITIPAGIKSFTIYHLIDQVGSLTLDDISLSKEQSAPPIDPQPPKNSIKNPSFEIARGTDPADWQSDTWGTNTASFGYVRNDGRTGTSSSKVTVTNYSSGDAKWYFSPLTTLTPGSQYTFSAWYKTNAQPHVIAAYVDARGVDQYLTLPNPLPAVDATTAWQYYSSRLDVPKDASAVTVYFLLSSNGWLQTDDFDIVSYTPTGFKAPLISLTFDDGWQSVYTNGVPILQKYGFVSTQYILSGALNTAQYMSTAQVQAVIQAGNEIASHTVSHPDLPLLNSLQLDSELSESQTALRSLFGQTVAQSFASPTGTYNQTTLTAIKQYYQSHRSTDVGYNTKDSFNRYNILVQNITTDTTPAELATWVQKAQSEKSWLVLVYHEVRATGGDQYTVTPENLDAELAIIKASGIEVKTISQALAIIAAQL